MPNKSKIIFFVRCTFAAVSKQKVDACRNPKLRLPKIRILFSKRRMSKYFFFNKDHFTGLITKLYQAVLTAIDFLIERLTKPFERIEKFCERLIKPFERPEKFSEWLIKPFERTEKFSEWLTKPFERIEKFSEWFPKPFERIDDFS